jgi:hypothetical protein
MPNSKKDLGTKKRKHLTSIVRRTVKKRDLLRTKLEWNIDLYDGLLSCGHVILGRHGNIASLYTWTKRKRAGDYPLPRFDSVEVALLNRRHEELANQICAELSRKGYAVEMTQGYTGRNFSHQSLDK